MHWKGDGMRELTLRCVVFCGLLLQRPGVALEVPPKVAEERVPEGQGRQGIIFGRASAGVALALLLAGYMTEEGQSRKPLILGTVGFCLIWYGADFEDARSASVRQLKVLSLIAGAAVMGAALVWYGASIRDTDPKLTHALKGAALFIGALSFRLLVAILLEED